jgi:hypothetical protein
VSPERLSQWKIPMTPSGMELATFRIVVQCLNQPHYTSFGDTNILGSVQITFLSSYSDIMHLNYRRVIPAAQLTLRGDRTPCLYSIKYRRGLLRTLCNIYRAGRIKISPSCSYLVTELIFIMTYVRVNKGCVL